MGTLLLIIISICLIVGLIAIIAIISFVAKIMAKTRQARRSLASTAKTLKHFSKSVYGTDNILEGIERQEFEYSTRHKNVSNKTSYLLPQITKDFPDFNCEEMAKRSNNVLTSYLISIDEMNADKLSEGNEELRDKLALHIHMLTDKNYEEHFERIKIHQTEITNYAKTDGRCVITFQSSLEYIYYITCEGKIKTGRNDRMQQMRYETDLIYVQDRDQIKNAKDFALGINCPNCGAPIENLGEKQCKYCGTPIVALNLYAFTFSEVREVK